MTAILLSVDTTLESATFLKYGPTAEIEQQLKLHTATTTQQSTEQINRYLTHLDLPIVDSFDEQFVMIDLDGFGYSPSEQDQICQYMLNHTLHTATYQIAKAFLSGDSVDRIRQTAQTHFAHMLDV